MKVILKNITPNAEINIVEIARVSSSRENKSEEPKKLIKYLLDNKHFSPFQHSYLTFEIETSKAIAIQLLRHLSFTFQEFSQRYAEVNKLENIEFRLQATKNRQSSTDIIGSIIQNKDQFHIYLPEENTTEDIYSWLDKVSDYLKTGLSLYKEGIQLGIAKECTRMILPMTSSTTIFMTGSVRSWIHFLAIRDEEHAQKEIQLISKEIKKIFKKELPIISNVLDYE